MSGFSPQAEQAKLSLEMQRRKIRQLHEELLSAEILEEELKQRLKDVETRERQPSRIMSFAEKLEESQEGLEEDFVEETFSQVENHTEIISVLRERETKLHQMNRNQLFGFVKTVLNARDSCLERDLTEEVNTTTEMVSTALHCLGSARINWLDLVSWEAKMLKRLVMEEVEGIPPFMKGMLHSFINKVLTGQPQNFARARVCSPHSHSNSTVE